LKPTVNLKPFVKHYSINNREGKNPEKELTDETWDGDGLLEVWLSWIPLEFCLLN